MQQIEVWIPDGDGGWIEHRLEVPMLPRAGDNILHEQLDIAETVSSVTFDWNEAGELRIIVYCD